MQLFPEQAALANLRGEVDPSQREYCSREEALRVLRELGEADFGDDIEKWTEWVERKYAQFSKLKGGD